MYPRLQLTKAVRISVQGTRHYCGRTLRRQRVAASPEYARSSTHLPSCVELGVKGTQTEFEAKTHSILDGNTM